MVEKHRIDSQEITISDKVDAFVIYEFKYYVEKSHAKVFMGIFPIPIFSTNRFWSTKNYHFQQTRSFHPLSIYIFKYIYICSLRLRVITGCVFLAVFPARNVNIEQPRLRVTNPIIKCRVRL